MLSYALFFAAAPAAAQTPPASQPPPAASQGRGITISVFTGGAFGNPPAGLFVPLPAGPTSIAVNGRPYELHSTWTLNPGTGDVNALLEALGRSGGLTSLDQILNSASPEAGTGWVFGGKIGIPLDERRRTRLYMLGALTAHYGWSPDQLASVIEQLEQMEQVFTDELFRDASGKFATATVTASGGSNALLEFAGGVEFEAARFGDTSITVRGGGAWFLNLGDVGRHDISFDYGVNVSGVQFHETDRVNLTYRQSAGLGFEAGVGIERRFGAFDLNLDFTVAGIPQQHTILATLAPVSLAGQQRGAIAFSPSPGTETIQISSIPDVASSLSRSITDHTLVQRDGFVWSPRITGGFTFDWPFSR